MPPTSAQPRPPDRSLLDRLAQLYGIESTYTDIFHRTRTASVEATLEALRLVGAPVRSLGEVAEACRARELELWQSCLEPAAVAWNGRGGVYLRMARTALRGHARVRIEREDGESMEWKVSLDSLRERSAARIEGGEFVEKRLPLPRLPLGYHTLRIEIGRSRREALILSAPVRAYCTREKSWGVFLPLYALRSRHSWGAGDFSDLKALHRWIASLGGSVVATLPFAAAFLDQPFDPSPYMPASRLFWNEFYVDPSVAPEFERSTAARRMASSDEFQREIERLRAQPLVDYRQQMRLKRQVLEEMASTLFADDSPRRAQFEGYRAAHARLDDYAAFRAFGEKQKNAWAVWPEPQRSGRIAPGDYDQSAFRYHQYVQWLAAEQLRGISDAAPPCDGRPPSSSAARTLYLDFPLGVHPDSYDVWREREHFALGAATGAPPDMLFTKGQNWGFPPPHPARMRARRYRYWIECIRRQFEFAKLVRIDHVMGLHRLFWIPTSVAATDGLYVRYRPEELYAILCIESHRSGTTLVGENLGTVPDAVNRALERHQVQQMYVLQYETQPNRQWPLRRPTANSVASLNTHDMPPFTAFAQGSDVDLLQSLGLFTQEEAEGQRRYRRAFYQSLVRFFQVRGGRHADEQSCRRVAEKCIEWLARSPARMVLVNLEDLWSETASQNVPGTGPELPNWRRKARYSLEEFVELPAVRRFLEHVSALRPAAQLPRSARKARSPRKSTGTGNGRSRN